MEKKSHLKRQYQNSTPASYSGREGGVEKIFLGRGFGVEKEKKNGAKSGPIQVRFAKSREI